MLPCGVSSPSPSTLVKAHVCVHVLVHIIHPHISKLGNVHESHVYDIQEHVHVPVWTPLGESVNTAFMTAHELNALFMDITTTTPCA